LGDLDPEHQQLAVDPRRSPHGVLLAHPSDKVADLTVDPRAAATSAGFPAPIGELPGSPPLDKRFHHDVFASTHMFDDQSRLAERAFDIARRFGAKIVRVFSYWRTVDPAKCFDSVVAALAELSERPSKWDLIIGLENEPACNIGTAAEAARILRALRHPNLKVVWDSANALVAGENPFPDGYRMLQPDRISHVHAKDCQVRDHMPEWRPLGTGTVDWKGQMAALLRDGYRGHISLETHWSGPGGNKLEASRICGWNLRGLTSL
jgi:L-ribulose-5-phosphate 3-epimerase